MKDEELDEARARELKASELLLYSYISLALDSTGYRTLASYSQRLLCTPATPAPLYQLESLNRTRLILIASRRAARIFIGRQGWRYMS